MKTTKRRGTAVVVKQDSKTGAFYTEFEADTEQDAHERADYLVRKKNPGGREIFGAFGRGYRGVRTGQVKRLSEAERRAARLTRWRCKLMSWGCQGASDKGKFAVLDMTEMIVRR